MSDLVAFLEARLAEDEAVARAATGERWHWEHCDWDTDDDAPVRCVEGEDWGHHGPDLMAGADQVISSIGHDADRVIVREVDGAHLARHDPARVLAGVAAKRRVLDLHRVEVGGGVDDCGFNCRGGRCQTLRALASEWAGADGWDEGWAL